VRQLGADGGECLRAADLFVENDVYIEAAPSKHGVVQGFFLYGFEPGGNRIEVTTGGYFVFDPDFEVVTWTAEERARGQFWGVKTVEKGSTSSSLSWERSTPGRFVGSKGRSAVRSIPASPRAATATRNPAPARYSLTMPASRASSSTSRMRWAIPPV